MKINNIKQGIALATIAPLAFPFNAFGWGQPSGVVGFEGNRVKDHQNLSLDDILSRLDSGTVNLNEDVGLLEIHLTAAEAKTSPIIQLTRNEPIVMAVEDSQHNRAVIQAISSQRHSDGTATVRQKTISPSDFQRKSSGGMLTDKQYEIFLSAYGGTNPANTFRGEGGGNTWYGTKPHETQTMMGLIMQHLGATHGYYVVLEPSVRSWRTSSGGPFKKKVTTHVEAHITPHWTFLTPLDVGSSRGVPNMPLFQVSGSGGEYVVRGGVNAISLGPTNNFSTDREFLHYERQTKSGWTGFALVFAAVAIGALTGGAGLFALSPAATAGIAGAGALTGLTLSGAELHQPVASDFGDLLTKSATAGIDASRKSLESGFGNGWRHEMVDLTQSGPLSGKKQFSRDMRTELDQWNTIIKPQ